MVFYRFNFPRPISTETFISKPVPHEEKTVQIVKEARQKLETVCQLLSSKECTDSESAESILKVILKHQMFKNIIFIVDISSLRQNITLNS